MLELKLISDVVQRPCIICEDESQKGQLRGKDVCASCIKFSRLFRGNTQEIERCTRNGNGTCDLKGPAGRLSCKFCRYQKCVEEGIADAGAPIKKANKRKSETAVDMSAGNSKTYKQSTLNFSRSSK